MENKVGAMQLPMQPEDRTESLRISLPPDYNGKTLTIAQSTPGLENSEKPGYFEEKAFLCPVTLFCGYSYESSIVAESFQTAYPATAFAVLAGATLFLFVYQAWHEKLDPAFLCLALFLILLALQQLFSASFVNRYFPFFSQDPVYFLDGSEWMRYLTAIPLLWFLAIRAQGLRRFFCIAAVLQMALAAAWTLAQLHILFPILGGYERWNLLLLLASIGLCLAEWRRGNPFFTQFCKGILGAAGCSIVALAVVLLWNDRRQEIFQWMGSYWPSSRLLFNWIRILLLAASLWAVAVEYVAGRVRRGNEVLALRLQGKIARENYEAIQKQARQTAVMRHDISKHLGTVRALLSDGKQEKAMEYINQVTQQAAQLQAVISSGNYMIDTILNSRLSGAEEQGVQIRIRRAAVPQKLALSDTDLCSLLLNAVDNAIRAAANPSAAQHWLELDLHIKGHFGYISFTNSWAPDEKQSARAEGHGYGLSIMERIAENAGGIMEVTRGKDRFQVVFLIPLADPPSPAAGE